MGQNSSYAFPGTNKCCDSSSNICLDHDTCCESMALAKARAFLNGSSVSRFLGIHSCSVIWMIPFLSRDASRRAAAN